MKLNNGKSFFFKKIISNYDDNNLNVNFDFDENGLTLLKFNYKSI